MKLYASILFLLLSITGFADNTRRPVIKPKAPVSKRRICVLEKRDRTLLNNIDIVIRDSRDSIVKTLNGVNGLADVELKDSAYYKIVATRAPEGDKRYFSITGTLFKTAAVTTDTIEMERLIVCRGCYRVENILFASNSYKITDTTQANKLLKIMIDNPGMVIEIAGHSDCRGTAQGNLWMSKKRAEAVAEYFKARGVKGDRMVTTGYGSSRSLNPCDCSGNYPDHVCTEEDYAMNRRVEFKVLAFNK